MSNGLHIPMKCSLLGRVALALLVTTFSANASEPRLGNCHMDVCSWSRELQRDLLGTSNRGALYEVRLLGGTSHHPNGRYDRKRPIKWDSDAHETYVFCSKTIPLVMSTYDNSLQKDFLEIGKGVIGAYLSSLSLYAFVCHNAAIRNEQSFAGTFGYEPSLQEFEAIDARIRRPIDVLNLP